MAKKPSAKKRDPRQWLKEKLGAADFVKFEKGVANAAKALAKGLPKVKAADVEGQTPCGMYCQSSCGFDMSIEAGGFSTMFNSLP